MNLATLALILALVCFIADAAAGPRFPRVRFVSIGLALFMFSLLVTGSLRTP